MKNDQPTLVVRGDRQLAIFVLLLLTSIDGFMLYQQGKELFDWKHVDANAGPTIVFAMFMVLTILSLISLFLNLPRLKMDATGVWKRRNLFSHSLKLVVTWDNISYYTTQVIPDRSLPTQNLVIRKKEPDEPVNIGITDSNISREDILSLLSCYAKQYGFNNFVEELNRPVEGS